MIVMTDGLNALTGNAIRSALMRFTRSPLSGATTGAACTALLQSSSATTVAAVGFVGAGLMSFPSALGIIFGANIGTTITGWMVALLGFKLQLGLLVLPLVLIGSIMRLFGSGRVANIGYAIAGFGLIFIGITMLQQGMSDLQELFTFSQAGNDSVTGRIQLLLLGILFTVITQSSSAGVTTTLTALFSGMIGFEQAAAHVIGMDIGTTVTAALATIAPISQSIARATDAPIICLIMITARRYLGGSALRLVQSAAGCSPIADSRETRSVPQVAAAAVEIPTNAFLVST